MTTVQERLGQIRGEMKAAVELGNAVWLDDLRREQYALWQREQDDAHDRDAVAGARRGPGAMMTIQINYRGHEIRASREKSLGGDTLLYYSVIRESDGYICVDGFESGDETEGGMVAMLRKDVDAALASIDPWDEQYDREVTR